jgi:hypothetical protein
LTTGRYGTARPSRYFEPQAVLEKLGIKLPVDGDRSTTSAIQDVSRKRTSPALK